MALGDGDDRAVTQSARVSRATAMAKRWLFTETTRPTREISRAMDQTMLAAMVILLMLRCGCIEGATCHGWSKPRRCRVLVGRLRHQVRSLCARTDRRRRKCAIVGFPDE
jgi:hypothetical protein